LLRLKFYKIPFHEKLPKDNQFFKHYMQNLHAMRMKDNTHILIDRGNTLFKDAVEIIDREHEKAERSSSPVNKRFRIPI